MKTVFVDSDVFLRFFTNSDPHQHKQAADLLREAASGKAQLVTGPPVLFETAWVLRSSYGLANEEVLRTLEILAAMPGLFLTNSDLVAEAIALARSAGQAFADAYIAVSASEVGADEIATFNRNHFKKLGATLHTF